MKSKLKWVTLYSLVIEQFCLWTWTPFALKGTRACPKLFTLNEVYASLFCNKVGVWKPKNRGQSRKLFAKKYICCKLKNTQIQWANEFTNTSKPIYQRISWCNEHLMRPWGGQVVSVCAFYSDDPSSNHVANFINILRS